MNGLFRMVDLVRAGMRHPHLRPVIMAVAKQKHDIIYDHLWDAASIYYKEKALAPLSESCLSCARLYEIEMRDSDKKPPTKKRS